MDVFSRAFSTARLKTNVFIASNARTPLGSFQGSLKSKSATQLGAIAIRKAVERSKLPKEAVQEVTMGCVLQAGLGQAPARQAALFAGLDPSTPCTTVNKVCASGMKAIMIGASSLALGIQDVMVAGGMESLSNSPFYLARGDTPYGEVRLKDACNFDALTDVYTSWHMGKCAENTATNMGISRSAQDDYATMSHERLENSMRNGTFDGEIAPVEVENVGTISHDDSMATYELESIDELPTPWGQTISRGSSSKLADGAAACVLINDAGIERYNVKPAAKILGFVDSAQSPVDWPTSPAAGIEQLLRQLELSKDHVDMWEINEAFAVVVLANAKLLGLDNLDKVNVNGGAIGMGHPFGMSGARITNHMVNSLGQGQIGIASLCNGGGGASTIAVQKL